MSARAAARRRPLLTPLLGLTLVAGCGRATLPTTPEGYLAALREHVERRYVLANAQKSYTRCVLRANQNSAGEVLSLAFVACDAQAAERKAMRQAVNRASPLPLPGDPRLFSPVIEFAFH